VPGKFSVGLPESGYQWQKLQDLNAAGITGAVYTCSKAGVRKGVVLSILYHEFLDDTNRREYVVGQYEGFRKSQERINGKIIEGETPSFTSKVPDRVSYQVKVQLADGSTLYCYTVIVFGKSTISFNGAAVDANEAKALCEKTADSFKELN
jgi:hypothetical protein